MGCISLLLLGFSFMWIFLHYFNNYASKKLPPGPFPLPIVGSLFKLGHKPHESLATLAKTYGPIMTLKLGYLTTIVISSAPMAKEVLHKHDHAFADRAVPDSARALNHHRESIVWLPASSLEWRNLRKICLTQIFNTKILEENKDLRQKKMKQLVAYINDCCKTSDQVVNIGLVAFTTTLNLISNTLFSLDLAHLNSESSQEFKDLVWEVMEAAGKPNIADFFPVLRQIDPQGVRRRMVTHTKKFFEIFDGIIQQRLQFRGSCTNHDLLDVLLDYNKHNTSNFSLNQIKHLLGDLIMAGTETSASTTEWAMAELLCKPEVMAKARLELKEIVGKENPVEESDITRLPYLQAIVKETLRLHPAAPLLIPHKAVIDVNICGFTVPKNAQVMVNAWTIGRDPKIWVNPSSFIPERFLGSEIDFKGRDFELIPFGAGRRMCPGLPLAFRMVHIILASLLHSFDWKLQDGIAPHDIDMKDKFGLTLHKAEPLLAIPVKEIN